MLRLTAGAIDVSFFPQFFGNFADSWDAGSTYQSALVNEVDPVTTAGTFALIDLLGIGWVGAGGIRKYSPATLVWP